MTMPDIIDEIDRLHAEATPSTWSVSDSGVCGNAGTVCQITPQFTDRGSMRRCDAELTTTLVNNWPAIRERLREAERLLLRYRNNTPLGHQPHMIASEVDRHFAAIEAATKEATP